MIRLPNNIKYQHLQYNGCQWVTKRA